MIKVIYISVACLCLIFLCTNLVTLINIFSDKLWSMYSQDLARVSFSFVTRVGIRYSNRLICQRTIRLSNVWFVLFRRCMMTAKKDEENINWPKFGALFIAVFTNFVNYKNIKVAIHWESSATIYLVLTKSNLKSLRAFTKLFVPKCHHSVFYNRTECKI